MAMIPARGQHGYWQAAFKGSMHRSASAHDWRLVLQANEPQIVKLATSSSNPQRKPPADTVAQQPNTSNRSFNVSNFMYGRRAETERQPLPVGGLRASGWSGAAGEGGEHRAEVVEVDPVHHLPHEWRQPHKATA